MAKTLPVLILKEFTILPKQTQKLEITSSISLEILKESTQKYNGELIIVSPQNQLEEKPDIEDLPLVAVTVKIVKQIPLDEEHIRVTLEGMKRIKIQEYIRSQVDSSILECHYLSLKSEDIAEDQKLSYQKEMNRLFNQYSKYVPVSNDKENERCTYTFEEYVDYLMGLLPITKEKKQEFLEEKSVLKRTQKLIDELVIQLNLVKLDKEIHSKIEQGLTENEKNFYLRSKMKEIQKELGEEDQRKSEIEEYTELLGQLDILNSTRKKIEKEIKKYEMLTESSPDISFVRNYLDLIFSLPWNDETVECEDLKSIEKTLNKSHFGLKNVKERILEYAAMKSRNPFLQAPIICLVGPPGVGKSTIAFSIAEALHRNFYKISVGGLNDSAELVGHRRTYLGSSPGRIVTALQKCGSKNPLILIDEVDKMVKDYKGDPASVLLDILDPNLNHSFVDQYLEEPFDLSHVLFLLTANHLEDIPMELRDRLEVIEISSYSILDKVALAQNYILPFLREDFHIEGKELQIEDEVLKYIILNYTDEAGVRDLRRKLEEVYRKSILLSTRNKENLKEVLDIKDINKLLEEKIVVSDTEPKVETYGLVKGLAVTGLGGTVLPIETAIFKGKGEYHFTGHLGEVMKESMDVVLSFLKVNAKEFQIDIDVFEQSDIHIHALEGATLKDGPSAGVAITTSLISLLKKKKIPTSVAMSGEMSLRGEVLPVSGIKEKVIGAYNRNVKTIFLPQANKVDVKQVPKEIISSLEIIYVKEYKEIFKRLFDE